MNGQEQTVIQNTMAAGEILPTKGHTLNQKAVQVLISIEANKTAESTITEDPDLQKRRYRLNLATSMNQAVQVQYPEVVPCLLRGKTGRAIRLIPGPQPQEKNPGLS